MDIVRPAIAGTLESSDCQVTVEKGEGNIFCKQPDLFCLWLQKCKNEKSCSERVGLSAVWNASRQRCKCGYKYQK